MSHLSELEFAFLQGCARDGVVEAAPSIGEALERRGFVQYVFEGNAMQGKWRLTSIGRSAMEAEAKRKGFL
jgi:hypothetical protein